MDKHGGLAKGMVPKAKGLDLLVRKVILYKHPGVNSTTMKPREVPSGVIVGNNKKRVTLHLVRDDPV